MMATLASISGIQSLVTRLIVEDKKSHRQVSDELYPTSRGLSPRSIRRFCEAFGIHATSRIRDSDLDASIRRCITRVSIRNLQSLDWNGGIANSLKRSLGQEVCHLSTCPVAIYMGLKETAPVGSYIWLIPKAVSVFSPVIVDYR